MLWEFVIFLDSNTIKIVFTHTIKYFILTLKLWEVKGNFCWLLTCCLIKGWKRNAACDEKGFEMGDRRFPSYWSLFPFSFSQSCRYLRAFAKWFAVTVQRRRRDLSKNSGCKGHSWSLIGLPSRACWRLGQWLDKSWSRWLLRGGLSFEFESGDANLEVTFGVLFCYLHFLVPVTVVVLCLSIRKVNVDMFSMVIWLFCTRGRKMGSVIIICCYWLTLMCFDMNRFDIEVSSVTLADIGLVIIA